jgi:acyl dehydratase
MTVDPQRALAATIDRTTTTWGASDIILYHLGVGAGLAGSTDPVELGYTYEGGLKVLPTFAVTPIMDLLLGLNDIDGIEIDITRLLHGEQDLTIHRPIPKATEATHTARVADVFDKGAAALIVLDVETSDADGPLCTNRVSLFARGEGGFGGERGSSSLRATPEREPDLVVESPTMEHQALVYRLSGDMNPLHADPAVATGVGFDKPILHGLCTYGIVAKAVIDNALDADPTAVARYQARFSGIVYPGETIITSMWRETDCVHLAATTAERGEAVISPATIWTH